MQLSVVQVILFTMLMLFTVVDADAKEFQSSLSLDLPAKDIAGNQLSIQQSFGKKPVYLKLWASWCVPCNQQMPHFVKAFNKYGNTVDFLSVNIDINDDKKAVDEMIKKYGMTMPTVVDAGGKIADTFNMPGTPLHVLLDAKGRLVHLGHKVDALLERRLTMLVNQELSGDATSLDSTSFDPRPLEAISRSGNQQGSNKPVVQIAEKGVSAVYFSATWCDWYLAESRPKQSKNCIQGQRTVNGLENLFSQVEFKTVVSRLWTTDKEVKEYAKRYKTSIPILLDTQNQTFLKYGVNKLPTLIVFKDGEEVERIFNFYSEQGVQKQIKALF